jgi:hypothetical protein
MVTKEQVEEFLRDFKQKKRYWAFFIEMTEERILKHLLI